MSVLGRLAAGWHPERAATIALAHVLDVDASPGMASAFVDLIGESRPLQFDPARVEGDPDQKDDSLPDVTIYDDAGRRRVLVEMVFWEGVPEAQPVKYLDDLPEDAPAALVYIAPRKRIRFLWEILRRRCAARPGSRIEDETQRDQAVWARVGAHLLLVASWTHVLDELRRVADDPAVEQDVEQLRGLTKRMETAAFLPLDEDEATDREVARRLLVYRNLGKKITLELEKAGLARDVKYRRPSYRAHPLRDQGREMLVHGKFLMRFGIEIEAWRDSGITPLWWVLMSSETFDVLGHWQRIKQHFDGTRSYSDSLYIPIRLRTGVDEATVVADAVKKMHGIADALRDVCDNVPPSRPVPARPGLLGTVLRGIGRQREPAATLTLHSVLAAPEIARRFIDLLDGGTFEVGRIGCEWFYEGSAGRVSPDLSIHDTSGTARIFVENKFHAELTERQPVAYLEALPGRRASILAFIVPEEQLDSRWETLKAKCDSGKLADESPPGDPRRIRVDKRTMMITSWNRVLDALRAAAVEGGHSTVEQDIAQLRGLVKTVTSDGP